ncbi:hypothetical protein LCI18_009802 [Fusarium solani-melongenae]|uniref:Uncharacterized protein n=1 Tax=Fusarium solani subsp. cucurbitae TaxID=2747967 RepID=A0ACD3ZCE4_FUSSC|nr:hypothetical protein LCI18_009802 [Fusarium solani-melongenae]
MHPSEFLLCLGTMNFGDVYTGRMGECSKETAFKILDHFVSTGGNFIDTANAYQAGQTEEWLGEWTTARQNRDDLVIATEYSGPYKPIDGISSITTNRGGNGIKSMRLSLEASLWELHVDILYVHWWDYTTTIPELMHGLNDLITSGKVLYLSMWNASMRDFERDIIPMRHDEGMGICPYGILNQGRFQTEEGFKAREQNNEGRKHTPLSDNDKAVSRVLEQTALSLEPPTAITDVALSYVMQKAPFVLPIVGGRKLGHIENNIRGLSVTLTGDDIGRIDTASPFNPGFPHTFLSRSLLEGTDAPQRGACVPGEVWLLKSLGTMDFHTRLTPLKTPS